jgi:predicted AAA+ superfamily ATPase
MPPIFGSADVLRVLRGFNPWWDGRTVSVPNYRRSVLATCRAHLQGPPQRSALLLSGMRGAGKTTMLLQLAHDLVAAGADPRSVVYISAEHPIFATVPISEALRVHRDSTRIGERYAVLLLDEIHYAHEWDRQVKGLLAEDGVGYHIVATESVQVIERALSTETQLGRWMSVQVPSLAFPEYLRLRNADPAAEHAVPKVTDLFKLTAEDLRKLAQTLSSVDGHFRRYLTAGGIPALAASEGGDAGRPLLHEDTAERILRRDVALHTEPRNLDDLKRLFMYLCLRSGEVFPVQRYANLIGASPSTVTSHLSILEQSFVVRRVPPTDETGEASSKPRHKVFITDSSMRNAQLLDDGTGSRDPLDEGASIRTSLCRHVYARFAGRGNNRIGYWRDPRSRQDVDLVVHGERGAVAFHCVEGAVAQGKDPLVSFCRRAHVDGAFIVTPTGSDPAIGRIQGLPTVFVRLSAPLMTYLLGREECAAWGG